MIGDDAIPAAASVTCAGVLSDIGGFHLATEAFYGVGDRGRHNRSELVGCILYWSAVTYRGFNTDAETLYGLGDRRRHNRPEITDPVVSGRLSYNNRITGFEMSGVGYENQISDSG